MPDALFKYIDRVEPFNFIKKDALAKVFSCE